MPDRGWIKAISPGIAAAALLLPTNRSTTHPDFFGAAAGAFDVPEFIPSCSKSALQEAQKLSPASSKAPHWMQYFFCIL
jgi:hypothetical protein